MYIYTHVKIKHISTSYKSNISLILHDFTSTPSTFRFSSTFSRHPDHLWWNRSCLRPTQKKGRGNVRHGRSKGHVMLVMFQGWPRNAWIFHDFSMIFDEFSTFFYELIGISIISISVESKAECLTCFTFSKDDRATRIDYFDREVSSTLVFPEGLNLNIKECIHDVYKMICVLYKCFTQWWYCIYT